MLLLCRRGKGWRFGEFLVLLLMLSSGLHHIRSPSFPPWHVGLKTTSSWPCKRRKGSRSAIWSPYPIFTLSAIAGRVRWVRSAPSLVEILTAISAQSDLWCNVFCWRVATHFSDSFGTVIRVIAAWSCPVLTVRTDEWTSFTSARRGSTGVWMVAGDELRTSWTSTATSAMGRSWCARATRLSATSPCPSGRCSTTPLFYWSVPQYAAVLICPCL